MTGAGRLGCIGVGAMGQALVKGVLSKGLYSPDQVMVADVDAARRDDFARAWGVRTGSNEEVARNADLVLVAVKPPQVAPVLAEIAPHLAEETVVVSVAAGVPLRTLEGALARPLPVVRAMPNTPCLVGAGAVALSLGRWAKPEDGQRVAALFGALAEVVMVAEGQMDAVTGLSGSGPAYVYTVIEALADGGVAAGLDRQTALRLAVHTVLGAARMVAETGEHPAALRDRVMSPAGTTAAGMAVLERRAVRAAFIDAVGEAARRSAELGRASDAAGPAAQGQAAEARPRTGARE